MNKAALVILAALALPGCAEVTRFQRADGAAYYHVDCSNTLRLLETCQWAARRTCPNGYVKVNLVSAGQSADAQELARCQDDNRARVQAGDPVAACLTRPHKENFFACKP